MVEKGWIYVMDDSGLTEGAMVSVYPLGVNVLLARVNGGVYAVEGRCAHMGCPLFTGELTGRRLVCPCHDWSFDVTTGQFMDAPELRLRVYEARVENGKLFIKMTSTESL